MLKVVLARARLHLKVTSGTGSNAKLRQVAALQKDALSSAATCRSFAVMLAGERSWMGNFG